MSYIILSYAPDKQPVIAKLAEYVPFANAEPVDGETYLESKYYYGSKAVIIAKYDNIGNLLALWTTFFRTEILNNGIESYCCYAFRSLEEIYLFYKPLVDDALCAPLNELGGAVEYPNGQTMPCYWVANRKQPYDGLSEDDRLILERFGTDDGEGNITLPSVTGVA